MKKYLCGLIGMILIGYTIIINRISSTIIAFSDVISIFGVMLIGYNIINIKLKEKETYKRINRWLKILVCIGLGIFLIIEGVIIGYPKNNKDKADYIIVLGAGLRNGYDLSVTLEDRLDSAIECADGGYIVVSGGQGADEDLPEAEAMKGYLMRYGIDEDKIIVEDKSTSTFQNLKYSKEKIEQSTGKSINDSKIKIVTTDFHAFRSSLIARRNGYKNFNIYTSKSINYLIPAYYFREGFAMVKTIIFDN